MHRARSPSSASASSALRLAIFAALVLALAAPLAGAHAVLESADPPVNGHAPYGTAFVEMRFTEDVEREYTSADVVEVNSQESWANGVVQFDDAQHNVVRLPVKPLADGLYTVAWRTLSVDSHTARGVYSFSVGNATFRSPPSVSAHDHSEHDATTTIKDGAARAIVYFGIFLGLGVPVFALVVDRDRDVPRRVVGAGATFAILGGLASFLALLLFATRTGLDLGLAANTDVGRNMIWRGGLLVAGGALLAIAALAPPRPRRTLAAMAALVVGAALVATSLGSHAAADREQRLVAIAADAVHLLMGSLWIGGIFAFLLVAWGRSREDVGTLVSRFTPLALASVGLILVTGTYASLRHIPRVSDLWTESYGRLVSIKVLLLAPLIALGYVNKTKIGPRLQQGALDVRWFRRALAAEAIVMVLVIGAAGILAASAPPDTTVQQGSQTGGPYELTNVTKTMHVVLDVFPNPPRVGALQRIAVSLHPLSAAGISNSTRVGIKVVGPNETEPDIYLDSTKASSIEWSTSEGTFFTSAATWRVIVEIDSPAGFDRLVFDVPVQGPGA